MEPEWECLPAEIVVAIAAHLGDDERWHMATMCVAWFGAILGKWKVLAADHYTDIRDRLHLLSDPYPWQTCRINDLLVSAVPSPTFTHNRFISDEVYVPRAFREICGQIRNHLEVFVNPQDLSYHNMENILLQRWAPAEVHFEPLATPSPHDSVRVWSVRMDRGTQQRLQGLRDFALEPLNRDQRGGRRVIFQDSNLTKALTAGIQELAPELPGVTFVGVNPVMRMNWFEPGEVFQPHLDTPFYSKRQRLVSLFTLLVYLDEPVTGARQVLRILPEGTADRVDVTAPIDAVTAVVFGQWMEHAGFTDVTCKRFLRSELVYQITDTQAVLPCPDASTFFNCAVYLSGTHITQGSTELYHAAAAAHWGLPTPSPMPSVVTVSGLHATTNAKQFGKHTPTIFENTGIVWASNGHDFWFHADTDIQQAACLVVLDFYNALGSARTAERKELALAVQDLHPEGYVYNYDVRSLTKVVRPNCAGDVIAHEWWHGGCVDARTDYVLDAQHLKNEFRRGLIMARQRCCASILGQRVYVHPKIVTVTPTLIHFGSLKLPGVNFASCQCDFDDCDSVNLHDFGVSAPSTLPPLWYEYAVVHGRRVLHIAADFFDNSWMMPDIRDVKWPEKAGGPRGDVAQRDYRVSDSDEGCEFDSWLCEEGVCNHSTWQGESEDTGNATETDSSCDESLFG